MIVLNMKRLLLMLVPVALLLGGCASYNAQVVPGKSLKDVQRFFVMSNLNDNHALDRQIAEAVKRLGLEADFGPRTMMPDSAQAIINYQDRWTWDFGDHLLYLTIDVRDALSNDPIAAVTFNASVPLREPVPATVSRIVGQLLTGKKS